MSADPVAAVYDCRKTIDRIMIDKIMDSKIIPEGRYNEPICRNPHATQRSQTAACYNFK